MKKCLLFLTLGLLAAFQCVAHEPIFEECEEEEVIKSHYGFANSAYIGYWNRYKVNFGVEKIYVRFPTRPTVTQDNALLVASSTDRQVVYKLIGYFPPISHIDPQAFFKRELDFVSSPPFKIIGQSIYQVSNGDWLLDYTAHDTYANVIIRHRSIVTPFNAYTLRAILPYGYSERFEYFLESFRLECKCSE